MWDSAKVLWCSHQFPAAPGTALPLQGSPNLMFSCEGTDLTGRSSCHGTKQTQLATMLSVNCGIPDLGTPWVSPMATPRKLKVMMISVL